MTLPTDTTLLCRFRQEISSKTSTANLQCPRFSQRSMATLKCLTPLGLNLQIFWWKTAKDKLMNLELNMNVQLRRLPLSLSLLPFRWQHHLTSSPTGPTKTMNKRCHTCQQTSDHIKPAPPTKYRRETWYWFFHLDFCWSWLILLHLQSQVPLQCAAPK